MHQLTSEHVDGSQQVVQEHIFMFVTVKDIICAIEVCTELYVCFAIFSYYLLHIL